MADSPAQPVVIGRRARFAADGFRRRSGAARACAGDGTRSERIAARGLAGVGGGWAAAGRGAEPARLVGPHGHDPFGHGRPYSRTQINHLLRDTWFTPIGWSEALYVPPISRGWFLRSALAWERTGATISAPFAGVHILKRPSRSIAPIPARRERTRLVPALSRYWRPPPAALNPLLAARSVALVPSALARRHIRPRTAVTPAPAMQREAIGLTVVAVLTIALLPLCLRLRLVSGLLTTGDERRQPVDVAAALIADCWFGPARAAGACG